MDPLTCNEPAAAALALTRKQLDCEVTLGPGFICVTTATGCGGGPFCAKPCP